MPPGADSLWLCLLNSTAEKKKNRSRKEVPKKVAGTLVDGASLKGKQYSARGTTGARRLKVLSIGPKGRQVQEEGVELGEWILPTRPLLLDTGALASSATTISLSYPQDPMLLQALGTRIVGRYSLGRPQVDGLTCQQASRRPVG